MAEDAARQRVTMDDGYPIPDNELPGMWERADFEGGLDEVRPAPAHPAEEMLAAVRAWMRREISFGALHEAARRYVDTCDEVGK